MTINLFKLFYTYLLIRNNIIVFNKERENKYTTSLKVKYLFEEKVVDLNRQWKSITLFSDLTYYELFVFFSFQIGSFLFSFFIVFIEWQAIIPLFFIFVLSTKKLFDSVKIIVE